MALEYDPLVTSKMNNICIVFQYYVNMDVLLAVVVTWPFIL